MPRRRFKVTHSQEDVKRAVEMLTDALTRLPEGHSDRATALFESARIHLVGMTPFFSIRDALDQTSQDIIDRYQNAQVRLTSALDLLERFERQESLLQGDKKLRQALLEVYTLAVGMLPRVAYFGLDIVSRLRVLANSDTLASGGAAHALLLEQPQAAVELMEQGRAVFWFQHLRLRTALNALPSDLVANLTQTAILFERGRHSAFNEEAQIEGNPAKAAQEAETAKRGRLSDKFETLLGQVRVLPGFERFMLPELFQVLCYAAAHCPVVVLLANDITCQAIAIENPDAVHQVQLPEVPSLYLQTLSRSAAEAARSGRSLLRGRSMKKTNVKGARKTEDVLQELWRKVISRIVGAMHTKVRSPPAKS